MKSYKVVEFGQPLQKVEEGNPAPQGAEVLVKVTAAGVCHSDVHLWEGFFDMGGGNKVSTQKTMNPPRTMGHEIVGEVVALGPDAKGAKVGDKAVVYPWIGCGTCWYCTNGREHLCAAPRALGVNKDGGYADHVLVPDAKYLYPYGNIPTDLACLYACSGITAFSAVQEDGRRGWRQADPGDRRRRRRTDGREVRTNPCWAARRSVADIDEGKRKLALDKRRDRRNRSARQGRPQEGLRADGRHRRRCGHRLRGRRQHRPVRRQGAGPRRTPRRRRPVRRHLLAADADVRLHRLPDRGLRDRQPGRDEGDDGPRHRPAR